MGERRTEGCPKMGTGVLCTFCTNVPKVVPKVFLDGSKSPQERVRRGFAKVSQKSLDK